MGFWPLPAPSGGRGGAGPGRGATVEPGRPEGRPGQDPLRPSSGVKPESTWEPPRARGAGRGAWVHAARPAGAPRAGCTGTGPLCGPAACEGARPRPVTALDGGVRLSPALGSGLQQAAPQGWPEHHEGFCSPLGGHTNHVNRPGRGCRRHSWSKAAQLGKGVAGHRGEVAAQLRHPESREAVRPPASLAGPTRSAWRPGPSQPRAGGGHARRGAT